MKKHRSFIGTFLGVVVAATLLVGGGEDGAKGGAKGCKVACTGTGRFRK